jgi:hypothetical protein
MVYIGGAVVQCSAVLGAVLHLCSSAVQPRLYSAAPCTKVYRLKNDFSATALKPIKQVEKDRAARMARTGVRILFTP